MSSRLIPVAALLLCALGAMSCGGGSTAFAVASMQIDSVRSVDEPRESVISALQPRELEVTGPDFSEVLAATCTIRFRAASGTPFRKGTAYSLEIPGVIASNGTAKGTTPYVALCGPALVDAYVDVILPSGFVGSSAEPVVSFEAPRLEGGELSENKFLATEPGTPVFVTGSGFAAPLGDPAVTVRWAADSPIFDGGMALEDTTPGTLRPDGRVSTVTPVVAVCGSAEVPARLESIEFANGACTPSEDALTFVFVAPAVTSVRPGSAFPALSSGNVVLAGQHFGSALTDVEVRWSSAASIFAGGTQTETTTLGRVTSPTTITVTYPEAHLGLGVEQEDAQIASVVWPSGTCTPSANLVPVLFHNPGAKDVIESFTGLHYFCERLGFHAPEGGWGDGFLASGSKSHWQGMDRVTRGGIPYIIAAAAGKNSTGDAQWPGRIVIASIGSRAQPPTSAWSGERMGSNRLQRNNLKIIDTVPEDRDCACFEFANPGFRHAGSIQVAGDLLAVCWEGRNDEDTDANGVPRYPVGMVSIYDLRDLFDDSGFKADAAFTAVHEVHFTHGVGSVGFTRLVNGQYLMMPAAWDEGLGMKMLLCEETDFANWAAVDTTGGTSVDSVFKLILGHPVINEGLLGPTTTGDYGTDWYSGASETGDMEFGGDFVQHDDWPQEDCCSFSTHQTTDLVCQRDGEVFLVCARNSLKSHIRPTDPGSDYIVVHRFIHEGTNSAVMPGEWKTADIKIQARVELHQQSAHPGDGGVVVKNDDTHGSYNGAVSTYITPSGEVLLYSMEHFKGANPNCDTCVNVGEWRHLNPNRFGNKVATLDRAWVELFATLDDGPRQEGDRMLLIDYNRRDADDYEDLSHFEGNGLNEFSDDTSGVRWCLPVGTSCWLYEDDNYRGTRLELRGTGRLEEIRNLNKLEDLGDDLVRAFESDGVRIESDSDGQLKFDFGGKASSQRFLASSS